MNTFTLLLRPKTLDEFIGQDQLVGIGKPIRQMIETGNIGSMIFWGPPASGKTTLAFIIANSTSAEFISLSGVEHGKRDLQKVITKAKENKLHDKKTILFVDEIHRWSKTQQDVLLPVVENGTITLIGATTENPSFTVISPLLSRTRVFVFKSHTNLDLIKAIKICCEKFNLEIEESDIEYLADLSNGDMRFALNSLEIASSLTAPQLTPPTPSAFGQGESQQIKTHLKTNSSDVLLPLAASAEGAGGVRLNPELPIKITRTQLESACQKFLRYDRDGEEHYNIISAVHKSLRSSNPDAALYWVSRMLAAGEDPLYICRRLLRFSSEDIGNANPNALLLANQTFLACQNLGVPECEVVIAQLVEYLGNSPKSNKAYIALAKAKSDAGVFGNLPVPLHLRNAPTKLMKELEYGKGYEYDPNLPEKKSIPTSRDFPDVLKDRKYFD